MGLLKKLFLLQLWRMCTFRNAVLAHCRRPGGKELIECKINHINTPICVFFCQSFIPPVFFWRVCGCGGSQGGFSLLRSLQPPIPGLCPSSQCQLPGSQHWLPSLGPHLPDIWHYFSLKGRDIEKIAFESFIFYNNE